VWSALNQRAAARLATLLRQLHAERNRLGSNEPINLILYSNGSNVGYNALENLGIAVDNVLILGGSIDSSATDFSKIAGNVRGSIHIFWSPEDKSATGIVDGIGFQGVNRKKNAGLLASGKLLEHGVDDVYHSFGQADGAGYNINCDSNARVKQFPADGGATSWLTRFMARNYYADILEESGDGAFSRSRVDVPRMRPLGDGIIWEFYDAEDKRPIRPRRGF